MRSTRSSQLSVRFSSDRCQLTWLAIFSAALMTCATSLRSLIKLGANSTIFWNLLWMLQSRSQRCVTLPVPSPMIWTSMCLNPSIAAFSANTCLDGLSSRARLNNDSSWSGLRTSRIPRPPPPSTALIIKGKPVFAAKARMSSTLSVGRSSAEVVGTWPVHLISRVKLSQHRALTFRSKKFCF